VVLTGGLVAQVDERPQLAFDAQQAQCERAHAEGRLAVVGDGVDSPG
jgi:hypothetical protein